MGELYSKLCKYNNLLEAFRRARKGKSSKLYVKEFETNLRNNIKELEIELKLFCYRPKPLETFILRDPKTRKISKSHFKDRIVHHAICILLESIYEKHFIYDSYANRKGKGTLKAIERFDKFKRKVSKNNTLKCYILKSDIYHYFENVHHTILLKLLEKQVKDKEFINLIKIILENFSSEKSMPLGNLTSQFFANVYLNELDQFVKYKLKVKYYIRYVDDFVIFDTSKNKLNSYKLKIEEFIQDSLNLKLHPNKTSIILMNQGVDFLGVRIFYNHKLLRKKNLRKFKRNYENYKTEFNSNNLEFDNINEFLEGWSAYAKNTSSYNLRKRINTKLPQDFSNEVSSKEVNRILKTI